MADSAKTKEDAEQQRRARALASPIRMRILRLCLHEARTNKELADELGVNPGTMLHHVRALVNTGFLAASEPRRGVRGSREVPYRATGASWRAPMPGKNRILVDTFLAEIEGLTSDELQLTRLGVKLGKADADELFDRFAALFEEYKNRAPDPDGTPISLLFAAHPELTRAERLARGA
jgi:predicted ArsR family transcriptional regulator